MPTDTGNWGPRTDVREPAYSKDPWLCAPRIKPSRQREKISLSVPFHQPAISGAGDLIDRYDAGHPPTARAREPSHGLAASSVLLQVTIRADGFAAEAALATALWGIRFLQCRLSGRLDYEPQARGTKYRAISSYATTTDIRGLTPTTTRTAAAAC